MELQLTQERYNRMSMELQEKLNDKQTKCNDIRSAFKDLKKEVAKTVATKGHYVERIELDGQIYYYHVRLIGSKRDALSKANKDKYIRFISTSLDPNWVVTNYYKRWKIEVFFEDVKTKGFNLEELNLTDMKKIRLIVAVTSFCYTLCLKHHNLFLWGRYFDHFFLKHKFHQLKFLNRQVNLPGHKDYCTS